MSEQIELKPCPFCGSEAKVFYRYGEYLVRCLNIGVCYGKTPQIKSETGMLWQADAIRLWNARAEQSDEPDPDLAEYRNVKDEATEFLRVNSPESK